MNVLLDAIDKVESTLETTHEIAGFDFPHIDSKDALDLIRACLTDVLGDLRGLDETSDKALVKQSCVQASAQINYALLCIGLILNSASIRNAFEVHYPLLSLAKALIGDDTKLVLSFEWNYVPFTYPLTLDVLPNFVVVGLPASEANNTLIIPAVGHELGHSVWRKFKYVENFKKILDQEIKSLISTVFWADFKKSYEPFIQEKEDVENSLIVRVILVDAYQWGVKQLEEIFCDFVALNIFGAAYLHAFAYLLAPHISSSRSPFYPENSLRAHFLAQCAKELDVPVPEDFEVQFPVIGNPHSDNPQMRVLLDVTDAAVKISARKLCLLQKSIAKSAALNLRPLRSGIRWLKR